MTEVSTIKEAGEFEQTIVMHPAFDRSKETPNYGIHGCEFLFVLRGPKGAVQFMVGTDWHLPHVQRRLRARNLESAERFDTIQPRGWDIGYHSPRPMYTGDTPLKDDCEILGGPCYYDGSSLQADEMIPEFLAGGTKWLWPKLEEIYRERFEQ